MLRSLKDLQGYTIDATDGEIGKVVDFFFDDELWTIRYLVADTGGFFSGRQVLITPVSFRDVDWNTERFDVALTREKVKNSPGIEADQPVSRQKERDYYQHYGYAPYWGYAGPAGYPWPWGMGAYPGMLAGGMLNPSLAQPSGPHEPGTDDSGDSHLRSAREVRGYHIQGIDDSIGHVEDYILDDETWQIVYLVIDTKNWWFGKQVLVSPQWANKVSWDERKVHVGMTREQIKSSPEWNVTNAINRDYEQRLHDHYGRSGYWAGPGNAPVDHSTGANAR